MKAIFLGKFQPPHLGHIRTILKVSKEYESVIVGITMGEPQAVAFNEVKNILDEVLSPIPNVVVKLISGTIENGTSDLSAYDFDVVVSGNQKVLDILKRRGYKTRFQARTQGEGYSGSEIRGLIENKKIAYIESRTTGYNFSIIPTSQLKPVELIYPTHFFNIERLIFKDCAIKKPIIIDAKHKIVLDGSHRYAFLLKHGFKYAPVITVNYDDESIFVGNHLRHRYQTDENFIVTKSEVVSRALNEQFFNARTTRHFFPFRKQDHPVSLDQLEAGEPRKIDYLIEKSSLLDEINADKSYVKEILDEIETINNYICEQMEVKNYLEYQLIEMEKKAASKP